MSLISDQTFSVCVFCGASNPHEAAVRQITQTIGRLIAEQDWTLIYGGGDLGLMGMVANSGLKSGGRVIGIIPDDMAKRERQHEGLSKLIVVNDLFSRKSLMMKHSDAFVILPGGYGTLDEFFEVLTTKQLGLHDKPIVILNTGGFWSHFLESLRALAHCGYAPDHQELVSVVETPEEMVTAIRQTAHKQTTGAP
uniref:Cytokinin riboside 5'-monophosphate phosphoribohydrolase n=1 Tax=Candidatus Kentrum sp. LFY TaxID=2126342 RepID=A0A450UMC3_9GAMM|nr:MAG: hypothetical protein BECKLFY1418A_GA0070994_103314 [Candidatus Kentron sp. LFY]